jgi:hypothetical protein
VFLDGFCNKLNTDITQRDGFHKKNVHCSLIIVLI